MKSLPNIEKSAFRKGEYVGYANGAWSIRRTNSTYGRWIAISANSSREAPIYAWRLEQMSAKLAAINPERRAS